MANVCGDEPNLHRRACRYPHGPTDAHAHGQKSATGTNVLLHRLAGNMWCASHRITPPLRIGIASHRIAFSKAAGLMTQIPSCGLLHFCTTSEPLHVHTLMYTRLRCDSTWIPNVTPHAQAAQAHPLGTHGMHSSSRAPVETTRCGHASRRRRRTRRSLGRAG